jgi:RNA polymerase sigma-70 factor (ECF subfamily)
MSDSPVVALNRAVAVARVHGPEAGLAAVSAIRNRRHLDSYHLAHVVEGEFEADLKRYDRAAACFRKALEFAELKSERTFLEGRLRECEQRIADA